MRKNPINDAYNDHRRHAKVRRIDFAFTHDEWVAWWQKHLGNDWFKKRGLHHGQYVMARWYDDGPYAPHNVKCILAAQNSAEKRTNKTSALGERNHKSKLTEQTVGYVRSSKKPVRELCVELGVSKCNLHQVINGSTWKHLNKKYPPKLKMPHGVSRLRHTP